MAVVWRSWLAFVGIVAIALAALATLSALQHDAILTRLVQQRLAVVAQTTAASFASVVNLGLPISTLRNARQQLIRAGQGDPAVTAIHAFNPSGIVVHSTDAQAQGTIGRDILTAFKLAGSARWSATTAGHIHAGYSIADARGTVVAGIVVTSSNTDLEARSEAMAAWIAMAAVVIWGLFAIVALVVLRLRLRGAIHSLNRLDRLDDRLGEDAGPETNLAPPDHAGAGILSAEITALEGQLGEAQRQFGDARRRLQAIGADPPPAADPSVGRTVVTALPETPIARVLARHLTPWAAALVLGSALALGSIVYQSVATSFEPEFAARTKLIGTVANATIQRAVNAGVPLENLVGAERYFDDLLRHFPEVAYFGVATGRIVYEAGTRRQSVFAPDLSRKDVPTFPILSGGEQIGYIIVDANPDYFTLQFRDVLLDFGVVVLVVLLLAFQVMVVVIARTLAAPFMRLQHLAGLQAAGDFSKAIRTAGSGAIDRLTRTLSDRATALHRHVAALRAAALGDDARQRMGGVVKAFHLSEARPAVLQFSYLNNIRLPLFLLAAADQLPIAFFPLYTRAADNPFTWLDPEVVISLPLAGYLIAIVFGSPFARPLAERVGHRRLIVLSAFPAIAAHVGLWASTSVGEIVLFRTVTGLGYAVATLACQDYVLDEVARDHRARSLGLMTAALFSGIFAGTAIGGVLADRVGQNVVFLISAALVIIAAGLTHRLLPGDGARRDWATRAATRSWSRLLQPLSSGAFSLLVFGLAIPAAILQQAFISFLVALQMNALGASVADTGRVLMIYFLAITFVGPVAPHLFDRRVPPMITALLGATLAGLSLGIAAVWPAPWSMLVAVTGAGIGNGLVRDSQLAAALAVGERDFEDLGATAILGSLRTLERAGSIVGLIAVALIAGLFSYTTAIAAVAGIGLVGAGACAIIIGLRSPFRQTEGLPPAETG